LKRRCSIVPADNGSCTVAPTWLSISLMNRPILAAVFSACMRMICKARTRLPCCARAASGQPAVAPPISVMNSRRFIRPHEARTTVIVSPSPLEAAVSDRARLLAQSTSAKWQLDYLASKRQPESAQN
jgi:hypothetical protein